MLITVAGSPGKFRDQLDELLRGQGFEPFPVDSPKSALAALKQRPPQLLVVLKPFFEEGFAPFMSALRADGALKAVPVLCVAPAGSVELACAGLDAGADDFIHRPFNAQIFLARVRTLLRRRAAEPEAEEAVTVLHSGPLVVKLLSRQALLDGATLTLTRLEFDLLAFFARGVDQVFKRDEILAAVWNYPGNVETRTLDKHVESLRRKLGAFGSSIETIHGVGYRFLPAPPRSAAKAGSAGLRR
jgi:DNA-binding response OmpR family regulator